MQRVSGATISHSISFNFCYISLLFFIAVCTVLFFFCLVIVAVCCAAAAVDSDSVVSRPCVCSVVILL